MRHPEATRAVMGPGADGPLIEAMKRNDLVTLRQHALDMAPANPSAVVNASLWGLDNTPRFSEIWQESARMGIAVVTDILLLPRTDTATTCKAIARYVPIVPRNKCQNLPPALVTALRRPGAIAALGPHMYLHYAGVAMDAPTASIETAGTAAKLIVQAITNASVPLSPTDRFDRAYKLAVEYPGGVMRQKALNFMVFQAQTDIHHEIPYQMKLDGTHYASISLASSEQKAAAVRVLSRLRHKFNRAPEIKTEPRNGVPLGRLIHPPRWHGTRTPGY